MTANMPTPEEPVKLALIGAGSRVSTHYRPILTALDSWFEVVAVCDPKRENANQLAEDLGVEPFYDIHELIAQRPMEAAVAVTPIPSHHSLSVYLSRNGIHNMVETTMANSLIQGREMVDTAQKNNVVFRVAENFFRKPIDRIVQEIMQSNGLEGIKRIFCYNDHTGFHNNSRWITFTQQHPEWVQSVEHEMPTASFQSSRVRFHDSETFSNRLFKFPDGTMVIDQASNIKAFLGRHPRPGYTEWHGERGTIVNRAVQDRPHDGRSAYSKTTEAEIRYCSDEALELSGNAGRADTFCPIESEMSNDDWIRTHVELPSGQELAYENPLRLSELCGTDEERDQIEVPYDIEIMGHLVDFSLAVRGIRDGEFTDEDALAAMMMEMGAKESALQGGRRIHLPIEDDLEADERAHDEVREEFGVDPLDVDGMLEITYPKP